MWSFLLLCLLAEGVDAAEVPVTKALKPTYTLKEATDNVQSVAFSSDSRWLASASYDNKVRVYSSPSNISGQPQLKHTLNIQSTDTAWSVAFAPHAKLMAVGQVGIELYDTDSFNRVATADNKLEENFVSFSPDGRFMASVTEHDQNVWLYSIAADKAQFSRKLGSGRAGKGTGLTTVAFSPDTKWLASGGSNDGSLWIHGLDSKNISRTWKEPKQVEAVAFSADSKWLVVGLNDDLGGPSKVVVYELDKSASYSWQAVPDDFIADIKFSPDGKWLAVGCGDARVRLYAWNGGSQPTLHSVLIGAQDAVASVAFSPDGKWLAAGTETQHVLLYNGWESDSPDDTIIV